MALAQSPARPEIPQTPTVGSRKVSPNPNVSGTPGSQQPQTPSGHPASFRSLRSLFSRSNHNNQSSPGGATLEKKGSLLKFGRKSFSVDAKSASSTSNDPATIDLHISRSGDKPPVLPPIQYAESIHAPSYQERARTPDIPRTELERIQETSFHGIGSRSASLSISVSASALGAGTSYDPRSSGSTASASQAAGKRWSLDDMRSAMSRMRNVSDTPSPQTSFPSLPTPTLGAPYMTSTIVSKSRAPHLSIVPDRQEDDASDHSALLNISRSKISSEVMDALQHASSPKTLDHDISFDLGSLDPELAALLSPHSGISSRHGTPSPGPSTTPTLMTPGLTNTATASSTSTPNSRNASPIDAHHPHIHSAYRDRNERERDTTIDLRRAATLAAQSSPPRHGPPGLSYPSQSSYSTFSELQSRRSADIPRPESSLSIRPGMQRRYSASRGEYIARPGSAMSMIESVSSRRGGYERPASAASGSYHYAHHSRYPSDNNLRASPISRHFPNPPPIGGTGIVPRSSSARFPATYGRNDGRPSLDIVTTRERDRDFGDRNTSYRGGRKRSSSLGHGRRSEEESRYPLAQRDEPERDRGGPVRRMEWLGPRTKKAFAAAGLLSNDSPTPSSTRNGASSPLFFDSPPLSGVRSRASMSGHRARENDRTFERSQSALDMNERRYPYSDMRSSMERESRFTPLARSPPTLTTNTNGNGNASMHSTIGTTNEKSWGKTMFMRARSPTTPTTERDRDATMTTMTMGMSRGEESVSSASRAGTSLSGSSSVWRRRGTVTSRGEDAESMITTPPPSAMSAHGHGKGGSLAGWGKEGGGSPLKEEYTLPASPAFSGSRYYRDRDRDREDASQSSPMIGSGATMSPSSHTGGARTSRQLRIEELEAEVKLIREKHRKEMEAVISALVDSQEQCRGLKKEVKDLQEKVTQLEKDKDSSASNFVFPSALITSSSSSTIEQLPAAPQTRTASQRHKPRAQRLSVASTAASSIFPILPENLTLLMEEQPSSSLRMDLSDGDVVVMPRTSSHEQEEQNVGDEELSFDDQRRFTSRSPSPTLVLNRATSTPASQQTSTHTSRPGRPSHTPHSSISTVALPSPTSTSFDYETTGDFGEPGSPGSLKLRPEHEQLLGDVDAFSLHG
ncbi:hypothetical protein SISNIDRAFT_452202 [Sistotremastrum niveocremeum HHB9708]|uniref:Uncharacterized protein n=1 Tax=Sistotremastrum niveocremeum HHB9708 TaxID=1314777 RepID=A0A164X131_9AGAM|nr:hypothetical protein SISNIDRAFT_452202 [Sistotremastrum niveocremeum HHB9708]